MKIPIFEHVTLRSLEEGDAREIFNTIDSQREYLGKWLPFVVQTTSAEVTENFVNATLQQSEQTFTLRRNHEFIGLIGFKATDKENRKTEIGYWLSESFQGKGVMTNSVKRLCEYAFSEMGMNRVQIKCAVGNCPSSAIPKRLGFTFEGIERAGELFPDGNSADIEIYSILKKEFNRI